MPARWAALGADDGPCGAAAGARAASRTTRWSTTSTSRGAARARAARSRASTPWRCSRCGSAARSRQRRRPRRRRRVGRRPRPPASPHRRRSRGAAADGVTADGERPDAGGRARPRPGPRRAGGPPARRARRARPLARRPAAHRPRRSRAGPLRHVGRRSRPASSTPGPAPSPTGCAAWPAWSAPGPTGTSSCSPSWACCTCSPRPASGSPSCPTRSPTPSPRRAGGRSARPTCWPASPTPTRGSSPGAATRARTASRCAGRGCAARAVGPLGDGPVVRRLPPVARHLAAPSARRSTPTSTATPGRRLRALVGTVHDEPTGRGPLAARRHRRRRPATRSAGPWPPSRGSTGCRRRCGRAPTLAGGRWVLTDDTGSLRHRARRAGPRRRCSPPRPARRRRDGRVDRRRRRPAHRPPRRPVARHRPPRRPVVRERGMTQRHAGTGDRLLARARHGGAARHRPARPARRRPPVRSPTSSPTRCGRRRRAACWRPWPPAPPPGGPASAAAAGDAAGPARADGRPMVLPRGRPPLAAGRRGVAGARGRVAATVAARVAAAAGRAGRAAAAAPHRRRPPRARCSGGRPARPVARSSTSPSWPRAWPRRAARAGQPATAARSSPSRRRSSRCSPPADAVVPVIVGGLASGAFGPPHRAVLVNFVARCRPDALRPPWPRRCGTTSTRTPSAWPTSLADLAADAPPDARGARRRERAPPPSCGRTPRSSTPASWPRSPPPTIGPARRTGGCRRGPSSPTCSAARSPTARRSRRSTSASAGWSRSPWPRWPPTGRCCCSACRARPRRGSASTSRRRSAATRPCSCRARPARPRSRCATAGTTPGCSPRAPARPRSCPARCTGRCAPGAWCASRS